jgi:hypothetical protein
MRAADEEFWRLLQLAKDNPDALTDFKRATGTLLSLTRTLFGATSEWGYTGHVWQTVQEATYFTPILAGPSRSPNSSANTT